MKKTLLTVILIFGIISFSYGQEENNNNVFYIINVLGADLYDQPSLESKIIDKIETGQKIVAQEIIKTEETLDLGNQFYLEGDFIKIEWANVSGFIFSSDLSKFKPVLKKVYEDILVPDIRGKEKDFRIEKRIEKIEGEEYEFKDEITEYENVTYTHNAFDGCFDHVYVFKNLSLSEVYHQLTIRYIIINETTNGNFIEIPKFIKKNENEYFFEQIIGATEDLKIVDNQDGTYTVSSYDCT